MNFASAAAVAHVPEVAPAVVAKVSTVLEVPFALVVAENRQKRAWTYQNQSYPKASIWIRAARFEPFATSNPSE